MKDKTKEQLLSELTKLRQQVATFKATEIERKRAEEELRKVYRALQTLSECNQVLVRATEESELLRDICRIIVEIGGYRLTWVGYAEPNKKKTVRAVAQAGYEEGYLETVNITWADTERGRGPTGTAIRMGKPCVVRDILVEPKYAPWRAEASRRGYASSIAFPLIAEGQIFGALNIYAAEPDAFDEEETNLLTELTDDLAYGITTLRTRAERKQAEDALHESENRLKEAQAIAHLGHWDLDLVENKLSWSDEVYRIFGLQPQEFGATYEAFLSHVHPDDREFVNEAYSASVKNKTPYDIVHRVVLRDGAIKYINEKCVTHYDKKGNAIRSLGTVLDITERKRAEVMLARAIEELSFDRQRMEELAKSVIEAQEKERLYLASEIHDDLLQGLVATTYFLQMLDVSSLDKRVQERKEKVVEVVNSSIESGRNLLAEIEPIRDTRIGLIQAIERATELRLADAGLRFDFVHPKRLPKMDPHTTTNILRIVQEALTNTRKHSKATKVTIKISCSKKRGLTVEIKDNGVGFDVEAISKSIVGHYGLVTMQERSRLVGGELTVASQPGKGTVLEGIFPLKQK